MENAFHNYLNGNAIPAEVIQEMKITIPTIEINKIINGVGRREVEKLLSLVPATKVIIDIDATWDGEEDTLAGLMAGKFIKYLHISGCSHEIRELPPSIEELVVRATADCAAVCAVVSMENIREITLIGGRVNSRTWDTIEKRTTNLRKLELVGTTIDDIRFASSATPKIMRFRTRGALINGNECSHEMVISKIHERYILRE